MDREKERSKYQGGDSFESFWGSRGLSGAWTCGVTGGTGAVEAVPHVLPGLLAAAGGCGDVFSRHPGEDCQWTDENVELKRGLPGDTQNESRKGVARVGKTEDQMVVTQIL